MGLYDRDYMKERKTGYSPKRSPDSSKIILIAIISFILGFILGKII
ncbi:MAG: hypothetical protein Q9M89_10330 [Persephonella sp.]|nr:hypothetical protein [Persephonella sp.]